jgi:urease subunit gamma
LADHGDHRYFPEAVREIEEVVPVNVSTWVLPSGVTVGR